MQARSDPAAVAEAEGPKPTRGPRVRSLRARLVLLVVSLLLPALVVAGFLIWDSSQQAYRFQERQLTATAQALSLVLEGQLREQTGLLNALSTSALLEAGDWTAFDRRARRALAGSGSWIAVRQLDGQQLVNTLAEPGAALPRTNLPRVAANRLKRSDGIRVSNLATGTLAKAPLIVVVKEVTLRDGRKVDLSVVTRASAFSELVRQQPLPDGWVASILDGEHRVIARSRDEARFRGSLASPTLRDRLTPGASGLVWGQSLDGIANRVAFRPVEGSDWTAAVGLPRHELQAPARRALIGGGVVAALLLLLGVLMAARAGARIARGVERLRLATAAGVGEPFAAPRPSGVKELDDLALAFAEAAADIRAHDARQQLLINELNHRVKNSLATLQSVASHSRRSATTVDEFHTALEGRIMAMSSAHELLTRSSWTDADLEDLARDALRPFEGSRIRISGPRVRVEPTDALNLCLIFYELATNAAKYGALSCPSGSVSLTWEQRGDEARITWAETGGPAVVAPTREGFGSRLLRKARETLHPSELRFDQEGVRCMLTLSARARAPLASEPGLS